MKDHRTRPHRPRGLAKISPCRSPSSVSARLSEASLRCHASRRLPVIYGPVRSQLPIRTMSASRTCSMPLRRLVDEKEWTVLFCPKSNHDERKRSGFEKDPGRATSFDDRHDKPDLSRIASAIYILAAASVDFGQALHLRLHRSLASKEASAFPFRRVAPRGNKGTGGGRHHTIITPPLPPPPPSIFSQPQRRSRHSKPITEPSNRPGAYFHHRSFLFPPAPEPSRPGWKSISNFPSFTFPPFPFGKSFLFFFLFHRLFPKTSYHLFKNPFFLTLRSSLERSKYSIE